MKMQLFVVLTSSHLILYDPAILGRSFGAFGRRAAAFDFGRCDDAADSLDGRWLRYGRSQLRW